MTSLRTLRLCESNERIAHLSLDTAGYSYNHDLNPIITISRCLFRTVVDERRNPAVYWVPDKCNGSTRIRVG